MQIYHFEQNNSRGVMHGPADVYVEAINANVANYLADEYGIYFDGVARGIDCACCGDRWHRVTEYDVL